MAKKILLIQGHPDAGHGHLGDALVTAYAPAAVQAGHEVNILTVAALKFPLLASKQDWENGVPCADILQAQQQIAAVEHLVFFYPLWLGSMPALLKGFLEQVLRPDFAFGGDNKRQQPLKGKSARIVITMGMPGLVYRWFFRAHSLKSMERNILAFCGIGPISNTLIGLVESHEPHHQAKALQKMAKLGHEGK
jgi:putative NADPH-quinone reductase